MLGGGRRHALGPSTAPAVDDPPNAPALRVRRRRFVAVAVTATALDLATKAAASTWLTRRAIDLPGPLDLKLVHNPGVAFGLGSAAPAWVMLMLTSAIAALLGTAAWRGTFASTTGAGLVLGGAVANIADRLEAGTVVDMLHLGWWPTFNLADVWITVGAVVLLLGETRAATRDGARPQRSSPGSGELSSATSRPCPSAERTSEAT